MEANCLYVEEILKDRLAGKSLHNTCENSSHQNQLSLSAVGKWQEQLENEYILDIWNSEECFFFGCFIYLSVFLFIYHQLFVGLGHRDIEIKEKFTGIDKGRLVTWEKGSIEEGKRNKIGRKYTEKSTQVMMLTWCLTAPLLLQ